MPPSSLSFPSTMSLTVLGSGLLLQKLDLIPLPFHVQFVLERVTWGQGFLGILQFSTVSSIPPLLHKDSFIQHWHYMILAIDGASRWHTQRSLVVSATLQLIMLWN
jgi:hypothetical protein